MTEEYQKMKRVPPECLKQIGGGRLKGMTDINPQWRYQIMDEIYGACGIGWKYNIKRLWLEDGAKGEKAAFCEIEVFTKKGKTWSDPVPGIGGSMLIAMEKDGLRTSDEAFKMATTDALSVALKALGVAADIYMGRWDGSKYKEDEQPPKKVDPFTYFSDLVKDDLDKDDLIEKFKSLDVDGQRAFAKEYKNGKKAKENEKEAA